MPVAIPMPFTVTPSRKSVSASSFRLTEKFVLLLVFSAFITFCFGAIFFLPDSSKLFFFRSDPAVEGDTRTGTDEDSGGGTGKDEQILAKIRKDHEQALLEAKDTLQKRPDEIKQDIRSEKDQVAKKSNRGGGENDDGSLPVIEYQRPPGATAREPSDLETREKRAKIKEVGKYSTSCTNKNTSFLDSDFFFCYIFLSRLNKQTKGKKKKKFRSVNISVCLF